MGSIFAIPLSGPPIVRQFGVRLWYYFFLACRSCFILRSLFRFSLFWHPVYGKISPCLCSNPRFMARDFDV